MYSDYMSSNDISCGRTMHTEIEVQSYLPLTETTLYIMLSLAPGPRHGYAIMKDVRAFSHNRVELSTGTLYSALKRLLDQNWIVRLDDPDPRGNSRDRKVYELSQHGRRVLKEEIARLNKLLVAADQRLVEGEP